MDFKILVANEEGTKKFVLDSKAMYKKPVGANCIMVRAGKIAFGKIVFDAGFQPVDTNIGAIFLKKAQTGSRFFKLPTALEKVGFNVSFPEYYRNYNGHNYGLPRFHDIPLLVF